MNWDDYLMSLAKVAASKSKDPSTKVGCVLVDRDNRVISVGYNGFPRYVEDNAERLKDRSFKLAGTLHAEENAILFARRDLTGAQAYVWPMPPCAHCTALLIQAGIYRIVSPEPSPQQLERWGESFKISKQFLKEAGVKLVTHHDRKMFDIGKTPWAQAFLEEASEHFTEALVHATVGKMCLFHVKQNDYPDVWVIAPESDPEFWMARFYSERHARNLCQDMGWEITNI